MMHRRIFALLCAFALLFACASAEEPSGAILAEDTVKPWLRPLPTPTPEPEESVPPALGVEASGQAASFEQIEPSESAAPTDGTAALSEEAAPPSSLDEFADEPFAEAAVEPTEEPNVLPSSMQVEDSRHLRVLVIGTDVYQPEDAGRSDTMILAQINLDTAEIRMVSFLRDLYVKIPNHGSTRLNAAYFYGGAELLAQTLSNSFGVTADRTVAVNFSLMAELIDRIGGVELDITPAERKQLNAILKYYNKQNGYAEANGLVESSGLQLLTGKQALSYSRIRKIDSDFARTGRQRKVLEAIFARVKELDALKLAALATEFLPQVSTDFSISDAVGLIPVLLKLSEAQFSGMSVPVDGGYTDATINGMMVLQPNLKKNRSAIEAFLQ